MIMRMRSSFFRLKAEATRVMNMKAEATRVVLGLIAAALIIGLAARSEAPVQAQNARVTFT